MGLYLVGEDDSSLFKKRTTWDFLEVLKIVEDGDIIKLAKNYCPYETGEIDKIIINKSITIRGYIEDRNGAPFFTNVLPKIIVGNKAQVTLEKLILRDHREKSNIVYIKENSTVTLDSVTIENLSTKGTNYPIIAVVGQSTLHLKETSVKPGPSLEGSNSIYADHSTIHMLNSNILTHISSKNSNLTIKNTAIHVKKDSSPLRINQSNLSLVNSRIQGENSCLFLENSKIDIQNSDLYIGIKVVLSELSIYNSQVENHSGNALSGKESTLNLDEVTFRGGLITEEKKFPCVILNNCTIDIDNVDIVQANYSQALDLAESSGKIGFLRTCSMAARQSTIHFETVIIRESIALYKQNKITGKRLEVLGLDNGKINFYATGHSRFHAEEVFIGRESIPNIRLNWNVDYQVKQTSLFLFDEDKQDFKTNDKGFLIPSDNEIKIDYFGKKPALNRLQELIGIENIKEEIESFIAVAEMNKRRVEQGLSSSTLSLHSLFLGNPGTGKTSVARLMGEVLFEKGVVSKDIFIEVSRSDLVGSHIGHTAIKTRKVLESALGGILFIDEAYTLSNGSEKDFGIEAVQEILTFMENYRSDIVIIFAGYTKNMENFLEMNEGLRSRIPNQFHFPDYSIEDLVQIGLIDLHKDKYNLNEELYRELIKYKYDQSYDNSNGRWARNINDLIIKQVALRSSKDPNAPLDIILDEDLQALMS